MKWGDTVCRGLVIATSLTLKLVRFYGTLIESINQTI